MSWPNHRPTSEVKGQGRERRSTSEADMDPVLRGGSWSRRSRRLQVQNPCPLLFTLAVTPVREEEVKLQQCDRCSGENKTKKPGLSEESTTRPELFIIFFPLISPPTRPWIASKCCCVNVCLPSEFWMWLNRRGCGFPLVSHQKSVLSSFVSHLLCPFIS